MFLKYFILLTFALICASTKFNHTDIYLEIANCPRIKLENQTNLTKSSNINSLVLENFYKKSIFDVRSDKLPEIISCTEDPFPSDCKKATKCTQKSGYYKIFIKVNDEDKEILIFCDAKTADGGWLRFLQRQDGSVNFTRSWLDYVNGFGNVETEYWLGLDNIHALTNNYGPQELYVYIENWEGESRFARYDNFVTGGLHDNYKLKSLGNYGGTAGDSLWYNVGDTFSANVKDNDQWEEGRCANEPKSGWWFDNCPRAVPTGEYLGKSKFGDGMFWYGFGGFSYSHKIMYLMIRST